MRNALILGGLAVVALVVALVWALNRDSSAEGSTTTSGETKGSAAQPPPRTGAPSVTPGLPGDRPSAVPEQGSGQYPKDYVVGDIRVRDHREGDNKPLDIPPNVHPAEGPSIPSTLTHEISQKLKNVV